MNSLFRDMMKNQSKYISKRIKHPDYFLNGVNHVLDLSKLDDNLSKLERRIFNSEKLSRSPSRFFLGLNQRREDYQLAFIVARDIIKSIRLRFVVEPKTKE
ncbi:hypothetical protein EBZ38_13265 [bacterium]|jgi:hypothetical protein|nr:hypothetical protein [bacterium]